MERDSWPQQSFFSSIALPVKLQTFFRGTKLRYFEVSPLATVGRPAAVLLDAADEKHDDGSKRYDEAEHDGKTTARQPHVQPRIPVSHSTPQRPSPVCFDLETLMYFHNFTTTTSLTLPGADHSLPAAQYWQTDVVFQALQRR
jgi:hypothetical protein